MALKNPRSLFWAFHFLTLIGLGVFFSESVCAQKAEFTLRSSMTKHTVRYRAESPSEMKKGSREKPTESRSGTIISSFRGRSGWSGLWERTQ